MAKERKKYIHLLERIGGQIKKCESYNIPTFIHQLKLRNNSWYNLMGIVSYKKIDSVIRELIDRDVIGREK